MAHLASSKKTPVSSKQVAWCKRHFVQLSLLVEIIFVCANEMKCPPPQKCSDLDILSPFTPNGKKCRCSKLEDETARSDRITMEKARATGVMGWPDPRNQETPVSGQFHSGVKWPALLFCWYLSLRALIDCTQRSTLGLAISAHTLK